MHRKDLAPSGQRLEANGTATSRLVADFVSCVRTRRSQASWAVIALEQAWANVSVNGVGHGGKLG